jgi:signal transduction histidine kinase/CheY-like chemotaxis protein
VGLKKIFRQGPSYMAQMKDPYRRYLSLILLVLSYYLAALVGLALLSKTNNIALVWPATAILLVYLDLTKPKDWLPALFLCWAAGTLANLSIGSGLPLAVMLSLTFTDVFVDALVGAVLLRRFVGRREWFGSLHDSVGFIVLACVVPAVVGAFLGGGTIALAFGAPFWPEWLKWWSSTAVSVVILAPLLHQISHRSVRDTVFKERWLEVLALAAASLALAVLISAQSFLGFLFLVVPILLWAAVRFAVTGVSLVAVILAATLVSFIVAGYGPLVILHSDFVEQVVFLHFFLMASYIPALICAVMLQERLTVEKLLQQSQKMEAVGQLSGGIAHDFNNILGVIRGNLELAMRNLGNGDESARRVEVALDSVMRGASLSDKLLRLSKGGSGKASAINVNEPLQALDTFLTRSLTATVNVRFELAQDIWQTVVDPDEFADAMLNLALNARDAMPNGGLLVIETANKRLDDAYVRMNPESRSGDFVMVSFSDNGIGMSEAVKGRVFEPFFSTKEATGGSGLGLAMVYGFVKRSGGHAKVYSERGVGTTVHLYLPRSKRGFVPDSQRDTAQTEPAHGTESILVVDDEFELLDVAVAYLESLGYTCLRATSGKEALEVLRRSPNVDLLFSDVIMPGGMDGYELALALRKERPEVKVLLTSGFTRKREEYLNGDAAYVGRLASQLLSKPYGRSDLAAAVRLTLDTGGVA